MCMLVHGGGGRGVRYTGVNTLSCKPYLIVKHTATRMAVVVGGGWWGGPVCVQLFMLVRGGGGGQEGRVPSSLLGTHLI